MSIAIAKIFFSRTVIKSQKYLHISRHLPSLIKKSGFLGPSRDAQNVYLSGLLEFALHYYNKALAFPLHEASKNDGQTPVKVRQDERSGMSGNKASQCVASS